MGLDPQVAEKLRAKSDTERMQIAFGMFRAVRRMIESRLREERPEWDDETLGSRGPVHRGVSRRAEVGCVGDAWKLGLGREPLTPSSFPPTQLLQDRVRGLERQGGQGQGGIRRRDRRVVAAAPLRR